MQLASIFFFMIFHNFLCVFPWASSCYFIKLIHFFRLCLFHPAIHSLIICFVVRGLIMLVQLVFLFGKALIYSSARGAFCLFKKWSKQNQWTTFWTHTHVQITHALQFGLNMKTNFAHGKPEQLFFLWRAIFSSQKHGWWNNPSII